MCIRDRDEDVGRDFVFDAVVGEPEILLLGDAVECFDLAQGGYDIGGRGALGGREGADLLLDFRGGLHGEGSPRTRISV